MLEGERMRNDFYGFEGDFFQNKMMFEGEQIRNDGFEKEKEYRILIATRDLLVAEIRTSIANTFFYNPRI